MSEQTISVTVCYARSFSEIWQVSVALPADSTIEQAIAASGVHVACAIATTDIAGTGIFGIRKPADHIVHDGDRVELYRALTFDPMESRRRRAAHRKAGILKRKHLKKSKVAWQEYLETTPEQEVIGKPD